MPSYVRGEDNQWFDPRDAEGFWAWSTRTITHHAPAAECPLCAALVILDGGAMTRHTDWHMDEARKFVDRR